jgi:hypothetical protein
VTNSFGCYAISPTILVVVNPLPQPVITRTNDILSTGSFASYQWYFNSLPINGATLQSYQVTKNGGYAVQVTDANGCINYSTVYIFSNVGVGQVSPATVKVYPNPVHQLVNIDAPVKVNVSLRDVTGRVILSKNDVKQIDMDQLAAGSYLLYISDEQGEMVKIEKLTKVIE